ncbi:Uncharacterised protein [BD1-7 clade bacterium]|uniref:Alpha-L-glutamate ligase-related protein ATP-grasp domain-containing protein n=1 Tax=BD1-7 clade bacterium TaxID=2029982 RepID=A0A5S9MXG8_9GAMM|nr:Uncharacterised protein [BD1-7 clade bacterium]CAA0082909.1 Uncharacterised protein [BD1-7 clade bacterium]
MGNPVAKGIHRYFQRLTQQVIQRQVPHALLSWRYFQRNPSDSVRQHRQVFLKAWPQLPRPAWWLIALYSYTLWYLWFAPVYIHRAWTAHRARLLTDEGVSFWRHLADLIALAYGHGIPPLSYYQYRLYRIAPVHWLDFIFVHELPQWHLVQSPTISRRSQQCMLDKLSMAQALAEARLPGIPTVAQFAAGDRLSSDFLLKHTALFFKPLRGSRKRGCMTFVGETLVVEDQTLTQPNPIENALNDGFAQEDYLVQPLLMNAPALVVWAQRLSIAEAIGFDQLVTFRLVTRYRDGIVDLLAATIELPIRENHGFVHALQLETETGAIKPQSLALTEKHLQESRHLMTERSAADTPMTVPGWRMLVQTVLAAHVEFTDIYTVGWDLALTTEGPVVIEGNVNWDVVPHQRGGDRPLASILSGAL